MKEHWTMADIAVSRRAAPPRLPGLAGVLTAQVRYQLTMLMRNPRALLAGLVLPGMLLALERGKAQHTITMATAAPRIAGLVAFSAAAIAFFTHASTLVIAREDGVLRRWHAAPLPTWAYFTGKMTATVLATVVSELVLILVAIAMTGLHLPGQAVPGLLAAGALGALALAAAGTVITAIIPSAQSAQPVLMLIYLPLILLSGAFGTIADLPSAVTTTMTYLPVQPLIDAVTRVLEHGGGAPASARDLAVLAGWAAGCLLVSLWSFKWDPHQPAHARHRAGGALAGPAA
jgi:ABC-2 type transport system permease protein